MKLKELKKILKETVREVMREIRATPEGREKNRLLSETIRTDIKAEREEKLRN